VQMIVVQQVSAPARARRSSHGTGDVRQQGGVLGELRGVLEAESLGAPTMSPDDQCRDLHDLTIAPGDGSGVLTRAAYDAAVKSAFDKADGNHDGKLTREEIRAASGQAGRPWGRQGMRHRDGERMGGAPVLQDSDGN